MSQEINTVKEAFIHQGLNPDVMPDLSSVPPKYQEPLMAFFQLMVVQDAVTENHDFDWENWDEEKWNVWWLMGSSSGSGFSCLDCAYVRTRSAVRSRLSFRTKEELTKVVTNPEFVELFRKFMHKTGR